jgi:hypothetical protein
MVMSTEIIDLGIARELVEQSTVLDKGDLEFVNSALPRLQADWEKRQIFRTETEMRVSVLNDMKFPTAAGKYWQAVREQSAFYEQLITSDFEYRRNRVEILKLERERTATEDDLRRMEIDIDIEERSFKEANIRQAAKDRVREIRLWQTILDELVEQDPTIDTQDPNTDQLINLRYRFERQASQLTDATSLGEKNNLVAQIVTADRVLKENNQIHQLEDGTVALRRKLD